MSRRCLRLALSTSQLLAVGEAPWIQPPMKRTQMSHQITAKRARNTSAPRWFLVTSAVRGFPDVLVTQDESNRRSDREVVKDLRSLLILDSVLASAKLRNV